MTDFHDLFKGRPDRGSVDDPTPIGYLALAKAGRATWNAWRSANPVVKDETTQKWKGAVTWTMGGADAVDFNLGQVGDFRGFNFGDRAEFSNRNFDGFRSAVQFDGATFGDDAGFDGVSFQDGASFQNVTFGERARFRDCKFFARLPGAPWVRFDEAKFGDGATFVIRLYPRIAPNLLPPASFRRCRFGNSTYIAFPEGQPVEFDFDGCVFGDLAKFAPGMLAGPASFNGAQFGLSASFDEVELRNADFSNARFLGPLFFRGSEAKVIKFENSKFDDVADFSNRKFSGRTEFGGARFAVAPLFHNADLHQDTEFDEDSFPRKPAGTGKASRAYRTLKLAMNKTQAAREELVFFRLEMREEREILLKSRDARKSWQGVLFALYDFLSDFGLSVSRPGMALIAIWLIWAGIYASFSPLAVPWTFGREFDGVQTLQWLTFSAANGLPLGGLDETIKSLRGILFRDLAIAGNSFLIALSLIQKIFTLLFLFLMGLALRNHFKMK